MSSSSSSSSSSSAAAVDARVPLVLPWSVKNRPAPLQADVEVPDTLEEHLIIEHVAGFVIKHGKS